MSFADAALACTAIKHVASAHRVAMMDYPACTFPQLKSSQKFCRPPPWGPHLIRVLAVLRGRFSSALANLRVFRSFTVSTDQEFPLSPIFDRDTFIPSTL